ncbi:9458_t:CDS:2 [Entrophospora sp. SA101]|nr:9458_t:CDS:2 [Entrophospora sp. SA101]
MDKFPERTLKSLTAISQHNMAESNKARADGDPNWWQIHEACLKAIGFVSNELISALNDKNLNIGINLGILFEQIIHQILNEPGFPFLRGRAFVFASQFASVLPGELTSGFIKAAIEAIKDPDGTIPVKVSALRALKSFCRNLNEQYVLPFQGTIIECVANLINVTTEDFLLLVLETLERAIKINRDVIFQYEGLIGPMVVDVWQKFPSEHLVMSAVNSISETLSINSTFIERALPALANIIMNPTIDSSHTEEIYNQRTGDYELPIGKAEILKKGKDVTVVGYGSQIYILENAIERIEKEIPGLSCELIDLRSILPWDSETVENSVNKTGRLVIAHEAPQTSGFAAEVIATIMERCFLRLEAPIQRVCGWDIPFPLVYEKFYLPDATRCYDSIKEVFNY